MPKLEIKTQIKSKLSRFEFFLPIIFGLAAYLLVVGLYPLDPRNIFWLNGNDPSQHYLGWSFFRYTPWSNPAGLNPNYGLDISSSIAFSDSIPLLAFFFKVFNNNLSDPFQYIGLWILICFLLQSWFSWKLSCLITENPLLRLITCGLLGVFAPPFLKRLGLHAALMGQFFILAAFYLYFVGVRKRTLSGVTQNFHQTIKVIFYWAFLCGASALTNIYLLAMVTSIWAASVLDRILLKIGWPKIIALEALIVFTVIGLSLWQSGVLLSIGSPITAEGFGEYKLNVLSIFDAGRYSYILKPIAHPEDLEEGFNYLGLGILSALIFVLALKIFALSSKLLQSNISSKFIPTSINVIPMHSASIGPILIASLILWTMFALSNNISIGMWSFSYPIPRSIETLAAIFRSSGRFFWPTYYLLIFFLLKYIFTKLPNNLAVPMLTFCLATQVLDTSAGWLPLRKTFHKLSQQKEEVLLSDPFWSSAGMHFKFVTLWPIKAVQAQEHWHEIAYFASKYKLGTNAVYLGRKPSEQKVEEFNKKIEDQLINGALDKKTLYLLTNNSTNNAWLKKFQLPANANVCERNNFIVIFIDWNGC